MADEKLGDIIEEMALMLIENPNIPDPNNRYLTNKEEDYKRYIGIKERLNNWNN